MRFAILSVFLMVMPSIILGAENIFSLDVTPEEAQKMISQQKLNVDYAQKIGENPIPDDNKNSHGDVIYQGRVLDNPSDYIEEHYLANQHHGQDGLGRYLFHYEDWNQGRMEAKNSNGEIRGQYKYKDTEGDDIIVNYWADSLGFHHEDNLPKTILEPVTDEPAVQAAREEHFRLWQIAAEAANANPDPMSDVYNRLANQYDEHQAQLEQANEIVDRTGEAARIEHTEPKTYWQPDPNEITGEPRGFFYSFDYPVKLLHNKKDSESLRKIKRDSEIERNVDSQQNQEGILDSQVNVKSVDNDEKSQDARVSAVHDVQIPRSKRESISTQKEHVKADTEAKVKSGEENVELSKVSAVHDVQVPKH